MGSSTITAALAGTIAVSAYFNAKYHIGKDLVFLNYARQGQKYQDRLKARNKLNVWGTFTANARMFAHQDCIWYSDPATSPPLEHVYSWSDAYDEACKWADWFLRSGVKSGECIGLYLQNSPEFMLSWLGMLAIGCYPAMINYNLVGSALVHCVSVGECNLLLVDDEYQQRVLDNQELCQLGINVRIVDQKLKEEVAALPARTPDLAYTTGANEKTRLALRYTSGTTGFPKGVMATTGRYYSRLRAQFRQMGIKSLKIDGSGDRWYISMPINHSTAGSATIICMLMPVTLCIGKRFSASRFWNEVRASRATLATYVGEIARYLLALPPTSLDHQHRIRMFYGNGMSPDIWQRFQERFGIPKICEFYGSTEGGLSHLTIQEGDYFRNAIGHDGLIRRWQLRNQHIPVLVDAETNDIVRDPETGFATRMPYGTGGELLVRLQSEAEFVGYWKNPVATEKKLARNVFQNGDLFYRTGDSLRRSPDGKWTFLDRLGDTFRWKGENISTAEVSQCLGNFPGVIDANVYGVRIPNHDGRAGCAALLLEHREASTFDLDGLLRHARNDLPNYAIPLFLRIVQRAALNSQGLKQDKLQPRLEGVDPSQVQGDRLYVLRGRSYVEFTENDWDDLNVARVRL